MSYAIQRGYGDSPWGEPTPDTQPQFPSNPTDAPPNYTPSGGGDPSIPYSPSYNQTQAVPEPGSTSSDSDSGPPPSGGGGGGGGGGGYAPSSGGGSGATQAGMGGGALLVGVAVVAAIGYWLVSK